MTALRPVATWDIKPVSHDEERKLLRKVITNRVCAHPDCDKPTESVHHLVPRGTVGSSSWFVRIAGEDRPVLHAIGLCGTGTTGHHGDLEEHRGWAKYEDGVWNWYGEITRAEIEAQGLNYSEYGQSNTLWRLVGPLSPQPGEVHTTKKKRRQTTTEDRRKSKFIRFRVPDDTENGSEVIRQLVETGREEWRDELGWSEDVPDYFVFCAAFAKAFAGR